MGSGGAAGSSTLCAASPTQALLTDFSPATVAANGTWGTPGQLTGHTFGVAGALTNDAGVRSSVTASISLTNMDLVLSGTVAAGDYAGGGMSFDSCVDTTNWTGIELTLGGTADGCSVTFQLETRSQVPPASMGTCVSASCYNFPLIAVTIPATPGTPTVVKFSDLDGTGMPSAPADFEREMFGLQWQFDSVPPAHGGPQVSCAPNMTISNVMWVSN